MLPEKDETPKLGKTKKEKLREKCVCIKNTDLWLLGYHCIQRQNQLRFRKSEDKHVTTSFEIT